MKKEPLNLTTDKFKETAKYGNTTYHRMGYINLD